MINFIYGAYGSGKTASIINMLAEDTQRGIHTFFIVPDQEALQFERLTLASLPMSSQLNLEILGFSRLYNRVCREYGGLSYSYITKPLRSLLMWKSISELAPLLENYGDATSRDISLCDNMLSAINEFKANGVTSASLEIAASKLEKSSPLACRLRDISLIYSCFDNFVSEKYTDSADDLSKLFDILWQNNFFEGCNVYLDSFYSYTAVQHKIIEEIFKSAENVTISIPLPSPDYSDISTVGIEDSHKKLLEAATRHGGYSSTVLSANMRAASPCLEYLSKNLWQLASDAKNSPIPDGSIVCEICDNVYAEAEAVSSHILKLLRGGARARDIVIIARDAEKYRGIIDTSLAKSDIPYYLSQKSDICSMPAIKLLLCAIRIKKYHWRREDVLAYIKTGLCDIPQRDINLFEEYINTWNIHGEGFLSGTWTMNPDGLSSSVSARGEEILCAANRVREIIVPSLLKFFVLFDAAKNTAEMCRALYAFLIDIGLEARLGALAERTAAEGYLGRAREISDIYGIILNTLASIGEVLGEDECDTEQFMQILRHIFDKTEIASIPTSIDEVIIGGADILRTSNVKYAFVVGLCEGEFPANIGDSGILSTIDRDTLTSLGIELSSNTDTRASDELMYIQRAFSLPSEKLFLFTHKSEASSSCFPSLAFSRVEKLFPTLTPHEYKSSDFDYLVPSVKNAASIFRSLPESEAKLTLKKALTEHIPNFDTRSVISSQTDGCNLVSETTKLYADKHLYLSASAFERYVKCPFNYFCTNVLKLRQRAVSQFKANDIGLFVHYMLEVLIKKAFPEGTNDIIDDDTLISLTEETMNDYLSKLCPPEMLHSKQMQHLYGRMKKLVLLLVRNTVKEFSKSEFVPAFFELPTNGKGTNPAPLVFKLDNGNDVSFSGYIDRVDIYKKDGEVYIRVVDYKTGTKLFSLEDIEYGVNLQMLLYLFTLCRNASADFRTSIGLEVGKDALPAGVIYLSTAVPVIEADIPSNEEDILSAVESKLPRSGLLLNRIDILSAMNSNLDSQFLAGIKQKKDGDLSGKALTSLEDFESIYEKLNDTVKRFASALQNGKADAKPLEYGDISPCKYCVSKPICKKIRN